MDGYFSKTTSGAAEIDEAGNTAPIQNGSDYEPQCLISSRSANVRP